MRAFLECFMGDFWSPFPSRKFVIFFSIIFYSFFNHSQPFSVPLNYNSQRKTGTTYMTNKLVERSQRSNKRELIARTEYSTVGKLHI